MIFMQEWKFEECSGVYDTTDDSCVYIKDSNPEIVISTTAEAQIKTLLEKFKDLEWMAGMVGTQENYNFFVDKIVLFEQEVSSGHVELTSKGNKEAGLTKLLGMIHSHNSMSAFHSGPDLVNDKNYSVCMVVDNDLKMDAKAVILLPCGKRALVDCDSSLESEQFAPDEDILKQAEGLIKQKVYVKTDYEKDREYGYTRDDQSTCMVCSQVINRAKGVYCNVCGNIVHKGCAEMTTMGHICKLCTHDGGGAISRFIDDDYGYDLYRKGVH